MNQPCPCDDPQYHDGLHCGNAAEQDQLCRVCQSDGHTPQALGDILRAELERGWPNEVRLIKMLQEARDERDALAAENAALREQFEAGFVPRPRTMDDRKVMCAVCAR
jgi:hypothetical protein